MQTNIDGSEINRTLKEFNIKMNRDIIILETGGDSIIDFDQCYELLYFQKMIGLQNSNHKLKMNVKV